MTPTTKRIRITLEDGRIYSIEAHVVAHHYATCYARGNGEEYTKLYEGILEENKDLEGWLDTNMNWWEHDPVLERTAVWKPLHKCEVVGLEVVSGP